MMPSNANSKNFQSSTHNSNHPTNMSRKPRRKTPWSINDHEAWIHAGRPTDPEHVAEILDDLAFRETISPPAMRSERDHNRVLSILDELERGNRDER